MLIRAGSLGEHLSKNFSTEEGQIDPDAVRNFLFGILRGTITIPTVNMTFTVESLRAALAG
jgi:hypothetical protein